MELQCPQCAKVMQVSAEEVVLHGGIVVCPQCLTTFDVGEKVPSDLNVSRVSTREKAEHHAYVYCPHCGQRIPQGINFCPYCGQSLKLLEHTEAEAQEDAPEVDEAAPAEAPKEHHHREKHGERTSKSSSSKAWNPMLPSYRYAHRNMTWRSGKEKAGFWFTVASLFIIFAQLALLAFIIYKVSLLS